ncbi:plastoquinol terminal oxidase [Trichocoleus desertorum AS-A10]|uniref:alternative oxidase n=1 Tax=Trichocoleus desertorum TaxID=1481672 RepID=UPI0032993172
MIRLLVDFLEALLNTFYRGRDRIFARFFVLETVARVPYFAYTSVLHLYETMGWWRKSDWLKVHFAESWNELHHLLIAESLGGNDHWYDRSLARIGGLIYYWVIVLVYILNPRAAYHFMQHVEEHAYYTYDLFLQEHGEALKQIPAPEVAINYYRNGDLYMFDEFQTTHPEAFRRPQIANLYDVFVAVREDELEHVKTMIACQQPEAQDTFQSPHAENRPALPESVRAAIDAKTGQIVQAAEKEPVEV